MNPIGTVLIKALIRNSDMFGARVLRALLTETDGVHMTRAVAGEYGEVVRHIVNGQYCQAWAAAGTDDKKALGKAINKLLAKG